jgi:flagellar assembly protein FliH
MSILSKIESDKVNYGNSFIVGTESSRMSEAEILQAKHVADNIVANAKKKALVIESKALSDAGNIIAQANEKAGLSADEISEAARQKGYEAGYKDGLETITVEMENKIDNLDNFVKSQFDIKKRIVKSLYTDVLDMVVAVSRKVCHTELQLNPKLIEELTLAAVAQLKEKENVTVIVNPEMAEKIYSASDRFPEKIRTLKNIKVVEDNSVSADGTIVESVGSRVDARLCAQIDKIAQQLYNELSSTSEEEMLEDFENSETEKAEAAEEVGDADEI